MATSAVPTKLPSKGTTDPDVTMEDLSSAKGRAACRSTSVGLLAQQPLPAPANPMQQTLPDLVMVLWHQAS